MKTTEVSPVGLLPRVAMERAVATKDPSFDGLFYMAVRTTGVFCRPSCPARPKPENVEFFASPRECLHAGYRPCRRCRPMESNGAPPEWVSVLMARLEAHPGLRLKAADLRNIGVTPERARRWFKEHYGMSFAAWSRGCRLAGAFQKLRDGTKLDDVVFDSGYESHSGFREAFERVAGNPPGLTRSKGAMVVTTLFDTPIGSVLAAAKDQGLCGLEFADQATLPRHLTRLQRRFNGSVVPGTHPLLERLQQELAEYFARERVKFTLPLVVEGTPFQVKVWNALQQIPYGQTISYEELAVRIGQPSARRAVALANGMNRISILIPCHRVIGKDGSLTGYGGGLWRKRLLLGLEKGNPEYR